MNRHGRHRPHPADSRIAFETSDPVSGDLATITMVLTTPADLTSIDLPAPEDIVDFEELIYAELGE